MKYQDQFFGTLDDFYQDCYDNNLPAYCFLEPRYSSGMVSGIFLPQNDQHPDSDVNEGEHLIFSVYQAIRSNRKIWDSSMLVIVYDEHGGIYDHVPPPTATPPGDGDSHDPEFKFDRYGMRVPAVIVSAYTDHVVCNDVFDHTSLIATARKLLTKGEFRDDLLLNRAKSANTFDVVLTCITARLFCIAMMVLTGASTARGDSLSDIRRACIERGNFHEGIHWLEECVQEMFTAEPFHVTLTSVAPGAGIAAFGPGLGMTPRIRSLEFLLAGTAAVSNDGSYIGPTEMTFALPTRGLTQLDGTKRSASQNLACTPRVAGRKKILWTQKCRSRWDSGKSVRENKLFSALDRLACFPHRLVMGFC